jgi:copper chaperone NosL
MKKVFIFSLAIFFCLVMGGIAAAQTEDDVNLYRSCSKCGMDREAFDFSRMIIEYDDGTIAAVCSLHCAAVDMANNIDKTPKSIKVGDFIGKQLVDAEKAFWVVGGKRPGVMTRTGKWAFEKKVDAEEFMKANQGQLVTFEEAIKMAYGDMYEDSRMIREKRKMKGMEMTDHR